MVVTIITLQKFILRCFLMNLILDSSYLMSSTQEQEHICLRHPWKWRDRDTSREGQGKGLQRGQGKIVYFFSFQMQKSKFLITATFPAYSLMIYCSDFHFLTYIPTRRHFCSSVFIVLLFPLIQYILNDRHSVKMGQQCSVKLHPSSSH